MATEHSSKTYQHTDVLNNPRDGICITENKLSDANIPTKRFVQLNHDKTPTISPSYATSREEIKGNYGVQASDGLVILDIDSYKADKSLPPEISNLPETFTVETAHGGEHLYYRTDEDTPDILEEKFGSANRHASFGKIKAKDTYVVGLGSELRDCDKEHHDCSSTPGTYTLKNDVPITDLETTQLLSALKEDPLLGPRIQQQDHPTTSERSPKLSDDEFWRRTTEPRKFDPKYGKLLHAANSKDPSAAGFPDDRSRAESALSAKFNYYLGNRRDTHEALKLWNFSRFTQDKRDGSFCYQADVVKTGDNGEYFDWDQYDSYSGPPGICRETLMDVVDAIEENAEDAPLTTSSYGRIQKKAIAKQPA